MSEKKNPAWCRALKGCLLLGWLLGSGRENLILFKPKLVFLWCWARHLAPLSTSHKWMQDTSHSVVRWLPLVVQRASAPGCCACPIPCHKKKAQGQDERCGSRCLPGCCWGTVGVVRTALSVSWSPEAGRTAVAPHLPFFALLGHHGGSTRAQNFQRQKHPFSMLFIKYRVHFMLLLAQANTFASWHSLRTAVHSIKTGERANVACVPASA